MHGGRSMGLTYFKRYRMEIDLLGREFPRLKLPSHYQLHPWDESLLPLHAHVKYLSFRDEIDANVFPCLGEATGCHRLMNEISHKQGFLPGTTWLASFHPDDADGGEFCGTVQGVRDLSGIGAIQNLGIIPSHRGKGIGTCLLVRALEGFRSAGLERVHLEVTAENEGAIRLYRRIGFVVVRTVYKVAEVAYS